MTNKSFQQIYEASVKSSLRQFKEHEGIALNGRFSFNRATYPGCQDYRGSDSIYNESDRCLCENERTKLNDKMEFENFKS